MIESSVLLLLISTLIVYTLAMIIIIKTKSNLHNKLQEEYKLRNSLLQSELEQERALNAQALERVKNQEVELASTYAQLNNLRARYDEVINNKELQLQRFEDLANKVLINQTNIIRENHEVGIKQIIKPLEEKISSFQDRVEKTAIESVKQHESLKEHIKFINRQTNLVSQEAQNLTKALKGDYKKQGNWGELILESILDKSGLIKEREYFVQNSERTIEGKVLRPDVIIKLPDEKVIVIDSKVSLVSYDKMVSSECIEEQKKFRSLHTIAIKKHIVDLSGKNYHHLYGAKSPDFVLMFIPIDTAFSSALVEDSELYNFAFDKNIVIVTSSTLLATLKTVETMWKSDKQNRHALEIATEAGKMYDKFVNFSNDLDKLGNQMKTTHNTYNEVMKKLSNGTGNLTTKAQKIKELGAKASKQISNKLLSEEDEGNGPIET